MKKLLSYYKVLIVAVIAVVMAASLSSTDSASASGPPEMHWVDWTSGSPGSAFPLIPGYAEGTITTDSGSVSVRYDNPQSYAFLQASGGTDFWRNGHPTNARDAATSPYTSDSVANIPDGTDIVGLRWAGSQTLTFSEVVANPVFAYVSLNGNGYSFDQDFDILSVSCTDGNDYGYWGCGTSYKTVVDLGGGNYEYQLNSNVPGEPHGTIRFRGSFDTLTWTSQSDEYWNGFTVGIAGLAEELPDTDGDGYSDDVDEFPNDDTEWADFDEDGVGDNSDAFPFDPTETTDTDGDGIGDNADPGPAALGRTGWEMFAPNPIVSPVPDYGNYGDERYYDHVGPVPAAGDPDWDPAPNGEIIGFSVPSRLGGIYGCRTSLDYTFFQTFVDIPIGTDLTAFSIDFSGMDDGSRVTVYNSLYPAGLVITGSAVGLGQTLSLDLTSFMNIGETNRVLVTQIDTCATGNNLHSAVIVLNGETVEAEPTNTAPEITVPVDVTLEATGPSGAPYAAVVTATDAEDEDSTLAIACVPDLSVYPLGATAVTCTVTDSEGLTDSGSFTVTVVDTTAPDIASGSDVTEEATGPDGAVVNFPVPAATDIVDEDVDVVCVPASGSLFPLGDTEVTCTATDDAGNSSSTTFTVTVVDTTAPVVSASVASGLLWPPNHKLVDVGLTVTASDLVSSAENITIVVTVSSNEETNGKGDGNTSSDWVVDGENVQLRAERDGRGEGRTYTITVTAIDEAGNSSSTTVEVSVPKSQGKAKGKNR